VDGGRLRDHALGRGCAGGDGGVVGKTMLHVAEADGHWVGLLGWCSAALKVRVRDYFISREPHQPV
jgi:hypothetical protein